MPSAQITLFLDDAGTLHAEVPNVANGQRKRFELPANFAQRNPDIIAELQLQRGMWKRQQAEIARLKSANDSKSAEQFHREKIAAEKAERELAYKNWFDSLTVDEQRREKQRVDKIDAKRTELELQRAHAVYAMTARNHGTALADRAIAKSRRPKRLKLSNGIFVKTNAIIGLDL